MKTVYMLSAGSGFGTLKAFAGTSRAGKHTLKIEVEYSSPGNLGYDLEKLQKIIGEQNALKGRLPKPDEKD